MKKFRLWMDIISGIVAVALPICLFFLGLGVIITIVLPIIWILGWIFIRQYYINVQIEYEEMCKRDKLK